MALAGKDANVKITSATATSSTDEAFTSLSGTTSRTLFGITDQTKRHWPRTYTPIVSVNSTVHGSSEFDVNHVQGRITFKTGFELTTAQSAQVTADVEYHTVSVVGGGREWTLDVERDLIEISEFGSSGWREFIQAFQGASVTINNYWEDSTFFDLINADSDVLVELIPDNSTSGSNRYEAWGEISSDSIDTPTDGVVGESVTITVTGPVYFSTST